jgi:hypothetical protein
MLPPECPQNMLAFMELRLRQKLAFMKFKLRQELAWV